jgi:hypothetical protein
VELPQKYLVKNLKVTLQQGRGHHKLVHGHLLNLLRFHHEKNWNKDLKGLLRSGQRAHSFRVRRIGEDFESYL